MGAARRACRGLVAAAFAAALLAAPRAGAGVRDDTAALQARLDAGGSIFLPKLPDGSCYETRGLWLSRDDTTITSDGACLLALGPGEARIATGSGKPVRANAVFFLDHSDIRVPPPVRVTISVNAPRSGCTTGTPFAMASSSVMPNDALLMLSVRPESMTSPGTMNAP